MVKKTTMWYNQYKHQIVVLSNFCESRLWHY